MSAKQPSRKFMEWADDFCSRHETAEHAAIDGLLARIEELEREKRDLYGRFVGLLSELHDEEHLSEQQCAKYLGVDLLTWRQAVAPPMPNPFAQEGTW